MRSTISEMGPLLLARLLSLNETQAGVLSIVFKVADDQGLLLLDLKDLRACYSTSPTTRVSTKPHTETFLLRVSERFNGAC